MLSIVSSILFPLQPLDTCVCVVQAAETEDLRKEWVGYLWQAMHLSASTTSVSEDAQ